MYKDVSKFPKSALLITICGLVTFFLFCLGADFGSSMGYIALLSQLLLFTGFVLGILSLFYLFLNRNSLCGYRYAIIAIVLSGPFFLTNCLIYQSAMRRKEIGFEHRMRRVYKTIQAYSEDNNGLLPDGSSWCDILLQYDNDLPKNIFQQYFFREMGLEGECQMAFNKNLSNKLLSEIPEDTVILFESDGDWNLSGDKHLLENGSYQYSNIILVNGMHVRYSPKDKKYVYVEDKQLVYKKLRWGE